MRRSLSAWTVDYGQGPIPAEVPHAWRQDVPVSWEGPARYRCTLVVPERGAWLVFDGVSYMARVTVRPSDADSPLVSTEHAGIWDAFSVPLGALAGREVLIEVEAVKNGGESFPVREVASGFLPYVFHTFGGIFRDVWVVESETDPLAEAPPAKTPRIAVEGSRLYLDGAPFYMRGALHWGWYPEVGHPHPSEQTIREEARLLKEMGFNTLKCCLWVPSHRALEILDEEGVVVWLELPLWDPSHDALEGIAVELERIVAQYRRHDNIVCWTVGCELSGSTPPGYRQGLVEMVRRHTGCPLVKDNSGGAEMYGGDPREFGEFYDFHPYCDTQFYPVVLDSLLPGPRKVQPLLLGEFNDMDVHRDLARLRRERPYWACADPDRNAQGVRWQFDLPTVLEGSRFALEPEKNRHESLMAQSRDKAAFVRKIVQEAVRAREAISGYVVTGWRDTPVSSSGMLDDWGEPNVPTEWNRPDALFLIARRSPPWVAGGNRPGWADPYTQFAGGVHLLVGAHTEGGLGGELEWSAEDFRWRGDRRPQGRIAKGKLGGIEVPPLRAGQVAEVCFEALEPGGVFLRARLGGANGGWPIHVVPPWDPSLVAGWQLHDPRRRFADVRCGGEGILLASAAPMDLADRLSRGGKALLFLDSGPVSSAPFWRESFYEFLDAGFWGRVGYANQWERFLPISGDCALDLDLLLPGAEWEVLMNRVDARTYAEAPLLARGTLGAGVVIATTLRPDGGLGAQPLGITRNPSGAELLRLLARELEGEVGQP